MRDMTWETDDVTWCDKRSRDMTWHEMWQHSCINHHNAYKCVSRVSIRAEWIRMCNTGKDTPRHVTWW